MGTDVIQALEVKQLTVSSNGILKRESQIHHVNARRGNPGTTSTVGYVKSGTNNGKLTLAASATADTWVIVSPYLHEGDIITSIGICGQIESGGNNVTVDYELRKLTAAAGGCTDASVQSGVQIAKSADYLMNDSTSLVTPYTVKSGEETYILLTCTTAAATDIEVISMNFTVTQK